MHDPAAELELLRNLYDELFAQSEQLRTDRARAVAALRRVVELYDRPETGRRRTAAGVASAALLALGEQP